MGLRDYQEHKEVDVAKVAAAGVHSSSFNPREQDCTFSISVYEL